MNPNAYIVHREFDPKPGHPDGIEFVRQPEAEVARYRDSIKRHVARLNADDTVQSVADALVREWLA